jgi:dienelactone hydrolase
MRVPAIAVLVVSLIHAAAASAAIVTRTVSYKAGDLEMKGCLVYDDALHGPRPGVVIFPEWWGLNDRMRTVGTEVAGLGYVAFVADMYGGGRITTDPTEAGKLAGEVYGKPAMRQRAIAALEQLKAASGIDPARLGATGYCFGGACALELAYSGADLKGVVTFHGSLPAPQPADQIKAAILVCHGAADTFETPEQITAFQKAMEEKGVDWQMFYFGHAVHAFTNPDAGKFKIPGIAYDEKAARRSWTAMTAFFRGRFER